MISLKELLNRVDKENKSGMIPLDDWRWPDVDHLATMGFGFDGDYIMRTDKPPEMKVFKKRDQDETTGKVHEFFFLEEPEKPVKRFRTFNDLIDYFDTYEQPEIDKNM